MEAAGDFMAGGGGGWLCNNAGSETHTMCYQQHNAHCI
jgi:hypothetical protein